ncbi:Auxin-induced protein [Macleaya cordata]|uniref:Auxin-induced protein n=1 Tax=Macleaya cordata TaxID=56857 RepID=A0A200Q7R7_MACCD|nr:Auxin-induced protein [Macleaya cordata]
MTALLKKILCCKLIQNSPSHRSNHSPHQGHVTVYVGMEDTHKFEFEAHYLNHLLFKNLLQLSVQEFGDS